MTVGSPAGLASTGAPTNVIDPGALLMQAVQLHQSGQLDAAGRLYEAVLRIVPEQPDALHLLGVLALQAGRPADAVTRIRRATLARPESATYHANLGVALQAVGRLKDARESLERAVGLDPRHVDALYNLGVTLQTLGLLDQAVDRYQQALALVPGHPGARRNLGNALHALGRHGEAVNAYRAVLALGPADAGLLGSLGASLAALGRNPEAIEAFEGAVKLTPADADAWLNLAMALHQDGSYEPAIESYKRALALWPDHPEGWQSLGRALSADTRYSEAVSCFQRALALIEEPTQRAVGGLQAEGSQSKRSKVKGRARAARPVAPPVVSGVGSPTGLARRELRLSLLRDLASALFHAGRRAEAAEAFRSVVVLAPDDAEAWCHLGVALSTGGALEEAPAALERAIALDPSNADTRSKYIFVLDLSPVASVEQAFAARREWNAQHALPLAPQIRPHTNDRDPERPLRVGYVSADFWRVSPAMAFLTILEHHDPACVEVVCYSNGGRVDEYTERFKSVAALWRDVADLSDEELAAQIRTDQVDVLVDLSGYTNGNRLLTFARKPAPVQVTAWGYGHGTGLDAIDAFFTDPVMVPPSEQHLYAEQVIYLPNVLCYTPPPVLPPIPPLPAVSRGYVTFGSYNRSIKITSVVLETWARILHAVPGSRLVLKPFLDQASDIRERLLAPLARNGIAEDRIDILGKSAHLEHIASFGEIDIQLDPFPQGGGITTLDGLLMGVPCVAQLGAWGAARASASILTTLGLDDLIARDPDEYVEIAARLAQNVAWLADMRATLRERLLVSPIGDGQQYTQAVEAAYRSLWRDWCGRPPTPSRCAARISASPTSSPVRGGGEQDSPISPPPRTGEGLGVGDSSVTVAGGD